MKKIVYIIFLSSIILVGQQSQNNFSQENNLPKYFYKRMTGTIGGKLAIVMNLVKEDTSLHGSYYYERIGEQIDFYYNSSIDSSGQIYIEEFSNEYDEDYKHLPSGIMTGKFTSNEMLEGEWKNPESNKSLKLEVGEYYPEGSAHYKMNYFSRNYRDLLNAEYLVPLMIDFNDTEIQNNINDIINKKISGKNLSNFSSVSELYNSDMDAYVQRYKEDVEGDSVLYEYVPHFSSVNDSQILCNTNSIVTIQLTAYNYEGGAHGNTNIENFSIDLNTGNEIKLDDILIGDYMPVLNKLGIKKIQEYYNFDPNKDLSEEGLFVSTKEFSLNDNFGIVAGGLLFQFNQYEIAAYVLGAPAVYIKFSEIDKFVKKDGILKKFFD